MLEMNFKAITEVNEVTVNIRINGLRAFPERELGEKS